MSSTSVSHSYGMRQAGARRGVGDSAERPAEAGPGAELPHGESEDVLAVNQDLCVGGGDGIGDS